MIRVLLLIVERFLDGAMRAVERAHEWNEARLQRRAVDDLKSTIDALGRELHHTIRCDEGRVACRVISLPRHPSKSVH